jgi:hypothetical protein
VPAPSRRRSTNSAPAGSPAPADVLGSTTPRLWTPELRPLTPGTSYGFDVIDFADTILGTPLDPWEQWAVIHAGELLPDGRPRFRVVLIVVARQNGKTLLARVLTLYWMFVEDVPLTLATNATLGYAKEQWSTCCDIAQSNEYLSVELGPKPVRATIGEEELRTARGARYKIAAANRRAGRSLTVHRLIADELREHSSWDAWNASTNAMNAVPDAQAVCISNQGDDASIVLDSLRNAALEYIETGVGDPRLGLFEWSAPNGSDPTDLAVLAQANPNLGRRIDPDALIGAAIRAKNAGGIELAGFRTEVMCMRVALLDSAVDPDLWDIAGVDPADAVNLAEHRDKVALCLDVSLDGSHATLAAAAVVDGLVRVEVVAAWDGHGCTKALRADLPGVVARVRPRTIGWFPLGPAAAVAADMAERRRAGWPPRRVKLDELRADVTAVCMGLAEQVASGALRHPRDPMLTAHINSAQKLKRGDGWVFTRRGTGPVDGAYAVAGAVHLARTLPPPPPPLSIA